MSINRREFLSGSSIMMLTAWPATAACAAATGVISPEAFGAVGDGRTDDTAAIQRCLDSAPQGGIVRFRPGAVYRIDTNIRPTHHSYGGLRLRPGQIVEFNRAVLKALPSRLAGGSVIQAYGVDRWQLIGPGKVEGEKDLHGGSGGEWGHGITAWSSSSWTIANGLEIANCWGDGVYVGHTSERPGTFCEDFTIDQAHIHDCRRNGVSIVAGRNGELRSLRIQDIKGTAPQAGIDLEPDNAARPNRSIRIANCGITNAEIGIGVSVGNQGVEIVGCSIDANNTGILISDNSGTIEIAGNPTIASRRGGAEGGAIRTVSSRPSTIDGVSIRNNGLRGGGFFVIDLAGPGYRDVAIVGNRIHASNPRVQGIARLLGGGLFSDNRCVIEANAGLEGEFFLQFSGVLHGGNRYENRSGRKMFALISSSRDLGGEVYASGSLTRR